MARHFNLRLFSACLKIALLMLHVCEQLEFGKGRTEEPREGRWNFNNKVRLVLTSSIIELIGMYALQTSYGPEIGQ